jgi:DDE superfamily endonuclease/Tc5 transposase DNA-binding domain
VRRTAIKSLNSKMAEVADDPLASALVTVRNGTHSQSAAAKEFGVSRDRIKRALQANRNGSVPRGRPPCIPREQEQILVTTVEKFAEHNLDLPSRQLQRQATALAQAQLPPATESRFKAGKKWISSFIKRNELKRASSKNVSSARFAACTMAVLTAWIRNLQNWFISVFGSIEAVDPDCVYNMDETPMNPAAEGASHIVPKTTEKSTRTTTGRRDFFTCVTCVSATGKVTTPMLIFEGKYVMSSWIEPQRRLPIEVMLRASPGHSMNERLFGDWLDKFAVDAKASPTRPVVLILDNHDSHITEANINKARSLNVHVFGLPKNTTSTTQPLDVGIFGPLKLAWRTTLDE